MKKLTNFHLLFFTISLLATGSSCSNDEETFSCNSNTSIVDQGVKKCGASRVTGYSATANTEEFRMQVEGGYEVRLINQTGLFEEGKSYQPYELYFTGLNRHISNSITIIKLDRTARILSFEFVFENEYEYNSQAFHKKTTGTVNEIGF